MGCRPTITDAGHVHRTPLVLAREERMVPAMIQRLGSGSMSKGAPEPADDEVDESALMAALAEPDPLTLAPAAFLAGRCQGAGLAEALAGVISALQHVDLDVLAWGYAEAALSLGLHGSVDDAVGALRRAVRAEGAAAFDAPVAADHLAQLGDPSGWDVVEAAAASDRAYLRQKAVRAALAFHSYEYLDVIGLLRRAAADADPDVQGEARAGLEEVGAA